jgi:hypothetical protein
LVIFSNFFIILFALSQRRGGLIVFLFGLHVFAERIPILEKCVSLHFEIIPSLALSTSCDPNPNTASPGTTRLRVRIKYANVSGACRKDVCAHNNG